MKKYDMTIDELIKQSNMSYTQFAAEIGVTEQTIRLWIWGKRRPSMDKIQEIEKFLEKRNIEVKVTSLFN